MKIIHLKKNSSFPRTGHELLDTAKKLEADDEKEQAIVAYKAMIKRGYQKELAYQRIMILLRNLGEHKQELDMIDQAIDDFKKIYSERNKISNKQAIATSKRLLKSMGILNKPGEYPEPLPRWFKRRETLKMKIHRRKKN
jgi:tetratricopeptide (TPR) repeat protein